MIRRSIELVDVVAVVDDGKSITRDPSTPSIAPQPQHPTGYAADALEPLRSLLIIDLQMGKGIGSGIGINVKAIVVL